MPTALTHTTSLWNIIIQSTSHDDLTEKLVAFVSSAKPPMKWLLRKKNWWNGKTLKQHFVIWRKNCFRRKQHQSISVTVDCKTNLVSSVKCQGFVFIRPAFFFWLSKQIKMLLTLTTLALLTQTLHLLLTFGEDWIVKLAI